MRGAKYTWAFCPGALGYRSLPPQVRRASRNGRGLLSPTMKLRPIDVKRLSPREREELRKMSKAIPLVADKEPIDVIFEDDNFLVVNKPDFVKMHPSHRCVSQLYRSLRMCNTEIDRKRSFISVVG